MRPLLNPALRRTWRDETTMQLGTDPARAVVLTGVDTPTRRLLAALDGTRSTADVVALGVRLGVPVGQVHRLLDLLDETGALVDAAVAPPAGRPGLRARLAPDLAALTLADPEGAGAALARRRAARVRVVGLGRVGTSAALLLAAAGIGTVLPQDPRPLTPADVPPAGLPPAFGRPRQEVVEQALAQPAPEASTATDDPGHDLGRSVAGARAAERGWAAAGDADVVLLSPTGPGARTDPLDVHPLLRAGTPHLLAAVREQVGVVGPFVVPGVSACLRCLDLHRTDRDPRWPFVAAQLGADRTGDAGTGACAAAVAGATASIAVLQVLGWLDTGTLPVTASATLEVDETGQVRRRAWSVHPGCGCDWAEAG
ncbi:MAG: ThiF family adenylyltransferase [Motilibacteraceae bacterium]